MWWALACAPVPSDAVDSNPEDSADSADSVDSAATGTWLDQAWVPYLELPPDRGLEFELDEDFFLDQTSVPAVWIRDDGVRLLFTDMGNWGKVSYLDAADGVSFEGQPTQLVEAGDCGNNLVDVGVVYTDDAVHLVVEAKLDLGRRFCVLDAESLEPLATFTGSDTDAENISVPEVLRHRDGHQLLYYLGDLGNGGGGGDSVRLATSDDGVTFTPTVTESMLPSHDTDPFPVWLQGGGVRLYHTHPVWNGVIAATDSPDAVTFEDTVEIGLDPMGTREKWLDPVVLHLPDDRVVVYFTRIVEGDGIESVGIGRAWEVR